MIRTTILRAGILAATTALAGVAFAGAASAADLGKLDQKVRDRVNIAVEGVGGAGGTTGIGGDVTQICPQIPINALNINAGVAGVGASLQGDNVNCVVITGDASGSTGIAGSDQE